MHPGSAAYPVLRARELIALHRLSIPIDVIGLARTYQLQIHHAPLSSCDGMLLAVPPGGFVITLNSLAAAERRRWFTIAHELGHYFLHVHDERYEFRCSMDYRRHREDREADIFAAELLMPEAIVRYLATLTTDPRRLAALFRVSFAAMSIRLEELGLAELKRA